MLIMYVSVVLLLLLLTAFGTALSTFWMEWMRNNNKTQKRKKKKIENSNVRYHHAFIFHLNGPLIFRIIHSFSCVYIVDIACCCFNCKGNVFSVAKNQMSGRLRRSVTKFSNRRAVSFVFFSIFINKHMHKNYCVRFGKGCRTFSRT